MPKRRWTTAFQDLRGRWIDNSRIVRKLVADAKEGVDWTKRLQPFLAEDAERVVPRGHG